jgi:glucosamine--fructose-6-phosphate aminotransferase (isomerizing)
VLILACGTSYYAGLTAKYWIESVAKVPVAVEIASEYRYRDTVPHPKTLVVTITQSGETADTLAALKHARSLGMVHTLTICNVSTSAMVRECALLTSPAPALKSAWHRPRPSPPSWPRCSC